MIEFRPGPVVRLVDGTEIYRSDSGWERLDAAGQVLETIVSPPPKFDFEPVEPRPKRKLTPEEIRHLKEIGEKFARFRPPHYIDSLMPLPSSRQCDARKIITCVAELLPWEQEYRMAGLVS